MSYQKVSCAWSTPFPRRWGRIWRLVEKDELFEGFTWSSQLTWDRRWHREKNYYLQDDSGEIEGKLSGMLSLITLRAFCRKVVHMQERRSLYSPPSQSNHRFRLHSAWEPNDPADFKVKSRLMSRDSWLHVANDFQIENLSGGVSIHPVSTPSMIREFYSYPAQDQPPCLGTGLACQPWCVGRCH